MYQCHVALICIWESQTLPGISFDDWLEPASAVVYRTIPMSLPKITDRYALSWDKRHTVVDLWQCTSSISVNDFILPVGLHSSMVCLPHLNEHGIDGAFNGHTVDKLHFNLCLLRAPNLGRTNR